MRRARIHLLFLAGAFCLSACKVGPNYHRPAIDAPAQYRDDPAPESRAADRTMADLRWWELFHDEQLSELIRNAVTDNYSLRAAVERVVAARERLRISRADLYPTIDGTANIRSDRSSPSANALPDGFNTERLTYGAGLAMEWEIDFWGRIRRANEAAFAELVATEESRREIYQALVVQVANAYFALREADLELEIAKRTLEARQQSLDIASARFNRGVTSEVDVKQAEALHAGAASAIPLAERRIQEQENLISFLLTRHPGPITRGLPLVDQLSPPAVPAGLPSALLERRPDIRLSEQVLRAETARVGEAKALCYPNISLTGAAGFQSAALSDLFTKDSGFWSVPLGLVQPIFNAGRIDANIREQQARQREAILNYRNTVEQAFREVADALIRVQKSREFRIQQERVVEVTTASSALSKTRYEGGVTTYLEVLDADRSQFEAEIELARARLVEMESILDLYRALGGGWEPADPCTIQSTCQPACQPVCR
jgi:NodT family efflux transporter outer membrane factor (OMF) lipoprotein